MKMMKRMLLGLAVLAFVAFAVPSPASASVSVFFGLPGFSIFAGPPVPYAPPVVVAPPVYYGRPYAPAYYYPRPYYYRGGPYYYRGGPGYYRGGPRYHGHGHGRW